MTLMSSGPGSYWWSSADPRWRQGRGMGCFTLLGIILLVMGVLFLLHNLGLIPWFRWSIFWSAVLIILGLAIILGRFRRS